MRPGGEALPGFHTFNGHEGLGLHWREQTVPGGVFKVEGKEDFSFRWSLVLELRWALGVESRGSEPPGLGDDKPQPNGYLQAGL